MEVSQIQGTGDRFPSATTVVLVRIYLRILSSLNIFKQQSETEIDQLRNYTVSEVIVGNVTIDLPYLRPSEL